MSTNLEIDYRPHSTTPTPTSSPTSSRDRREDVGVSGDFPVPLAREIPSGNRACRTCRRGSSRAVGVGVVECGLYATALPRPYTHRPFIHQMMYTKRLKIRDGPQAKGNTRMLAALGRLSDAGLAESNGSLPPGGWLKVTCGLTACTPGSAPRPSPGSEYGITLPFTLYQMMVQCFRG